MERTETQLSKGKRLSRSRNCNRQRLVQALKEKSRRWRRQRRFARRKRTYVWNCRVCEAVGRRGRRVRIHSQRRHFGERSLRRFVKPRRSRRRDGNGPAKRRTENERRMLSVILKGHRRVILRSGREDHACWGSRDRSRRSWSTVTRGGTIMSEKPTQEGSAYDFTFDAARRRRTWVRLVHIGGHKTKSEECWIGIRRRRRGERGVLEGVVYRPIHPAYPISILTLSNVVHKSQWVLVQRGLFG